MRQDARLWAVLLLFTAGWAGAAEIEYVEDFSLASDREEALKLLIPGSEDYFYYHCLHYQNTEQFDQVDELIKRWIDGYKDTPRLREIQNRQALLTYPRRSRQSLEFIRQRLGIQFNHQRARLGEKPQLPTRLDPSLIERNRLLNRAMQRHQNLAGFEDRALDWLVTSELNALQRRHLLERLRRPDHARLPQLIVADLKERNSKPFGSMEIHKQLLLPQLDELLRLKPDLRNQTEFVNAYLRKLRPDDDVNWEHDDSQREAYLDRLWTFVEKLDAVHNSLKAHVLFHRLVHDRSQGTYDKDRFLVYLRLPRRVAYIEPRFLQQELNRRYAADLNVEFRGVSLLPPVRNDEPLVRSYLHHFFRTETTAEPYTPYVRDDYLREQLAETKIVLGLGDPEQWYPLLPPEKYQALKDRVDLDFAFTNQRFFGADEPVSVDLFVKNVRTLIVKVFEVNTRNYFREQQREVNTDINLDGLVANDEQTLQYDDPPLRRQRRHFDFPSLNRAGVYVVDFIGNGVSSRVVVRKGKLRHLVRTSTAGHVFTIHNERNKPVPDATLWIAGHEYLPDDAGRIVVPFTNKPGRQAMVISQGRFSSLDYFQHASENYRLAAGFYVDRESLLQRKTAQVVIRPALYLNGSPVTLSVLEEVRLTITSTDREGVPATKEVEDFELFEDREAIYSFQVPARLSQLQFMLQAKVQSLSQNKKVPLTVRDEFVLNEIDKSEKIEDLHFTRIRQDYLLEIRGKTGEARLDRPVHLALKHRDFRGLVEVTVQTDESGRIFLGPLPEIVSLTAKGPEGTSKTWHLVRDRHSYHRSLHGVAESTLELPLMGAAQEPARADFSLLELRGDTFARDRFDALSIDKGMLRIEGLPRGDYDLLLKNSGERIRIRLTEGQSRTDYALSDFRSLELRGQQPLQIVTVKDDDEAVRIQLRNATEFARVHVFATRYQPAFQAFGQFAQITDPEPIIAYGTPATTLYVAGRNIGDEYRYIIDRKYATKFPGNMLERPSMLLNPWPLRSTETDRQQASDGEEYGEETEAPSAAARGGVAKKQVAEQAGEFASLDFLAQASAVLLNRRADENGQVVIPRKELGAHPQIHVVAVDPHSTVYRTLALAEPEVEVLDLRLSDGLDPEQHFAQQKQISVIPKSGTFRLPDIGTSKFEAYDSLAGVYALYVTLSNDSKLAEFSFLLDWPKLTAKEQHAKYSKYACHELNFFLYHRDPEFFGKTVLPYLKNKRDRTFLDEWLIGAPLEDFLQPWEYARLNVVERILLARRVAADRDYTRQHVRESFEMLPPDIDRFNRLFSAAIQGRSLDTSDRMGLRAARLSLETEQAAKPSRSAGRVSEMAPPPAPAAPAERMLESYEAESGYAESAGESLRQKAEAEVGLGEARNWNELGRKRRAFFSDEEALRRRARMLYQKLDKTQEWAETHYYQIPIEQQNAELVTVNAFWRDYADHDPKTLFLSSNLAEASRNFTEMMFALAVLDVPFEAGEHASEFEGASMKLDAASPLVVFHEEIREAVVPSVLTPILVSQNFFRHGDRYQYVDGQRVDKFVSDEFLVHVVYGCQVVVTNPTSSPQKLDVLMQIPVGALPVLNTQETRSAHIHLEPYHTETIEFHFYFPEAGAFAHYPVHVSKNEQLLAHADSVRLKVVDEPTRIDRTSWQYISQLGTEEEVLTFLREENLQRIDLDKIAFRMREAGFFRAATELLTKRHAYSHTLWSYGILHNLPSAVQEYLRHDDGFVAQCGAYLESPLLTIDPVARKAYQHLDYRPLVNARAHALGRRRQILNGRLHEQYHRLLRILSCRRALDHDDRMSVTYYLLLQDRIEEAVAFFESVEVSQLETQLQYDYFNAYLAMYREDLDVARAMVDRHLDHPVDRWRNVFAAVDQQLKEIAGGDVEVVDAENRDQAQAGLAASEPSFDLKVEAKRVRVHYQNLSKVRVNYYLMDIELLFSRNPFVQQYSSQFSHIRPNQTADVDLPSGKDSVEFPLPESLHNRNVLVEIRGGGQVKSQAYYSNSLALQLIENYGQLRVAASDSARPLSKVYVKVYARMQDGRVRYYKDGYTDLRGRFDFASLNTNELDLVQKFALLVLSDEFGAIVREANPPKR